jgi:hypothetical protein
LVHIRPGDQYVYAGMRSGRRMREVHLTCDECGTVSVTRGYAWPDGWYHWQRRDLCHACAVPLIIEALKGCVDEEDIPSPIGP